MIRITESIHVKLPSPERLGTWSINTTLTNREDIEECRFACLYNIPIAFQFPMNGRVYEQHAYVLSITTYGRLVARGVGEPVLLEKESV